MIIGYGYRIMTSLNPVRDKFIAFAHTDQQCKPDDVFAACHGPRSAKRPDAIP